MKSVCITWKTIHQHGDLWAQHLRLRKALFVDERGWQIRTPTTWSGINTTPL